MDELLAAAAVVSMFVLRLGVPLAITLAVAYLLRRLDAKWQAEAWLKREVSRARGKTSAEPELLKVEQPCWDLKGCDESVRAKCPTAKIPNIPCWIARHQVEGRLPAECYNCDVFSPRQFAAGVAS